MESQNKFISNSADNQEEKSLGVKNLYEEDVEGMRKGLSFIESRFYSVVESYSLNLGTEKKEIINKILGNLKDFLSESNSREYVLYFSQGGERIAFFKSLIQTLKEQAEQAEKAEKDFRPKQELDVMVNEVLGNLDKLNNFIEIFKKDITQTH